MSYIALARKWRPKSFSELVGQAHVVQALTNSLQSSRLHHAYLFTGTRGIGKTSIARLFAKALSCETGITAEPCLTCESCLAIEQGRYIDLIEIDGASKTRVEDTRELLDNIQYAPTSGRFKIYLIDEVHMLSTHSFNALLKTLEEPPAHVKFLLATTDPQKLPITVLSRCLQFHLKPFPILQIETQLAKILIQEECAYDQQALHLIASSAAGSMRDALSLLDLALASSPHKLVLDTVRDMLGYTQLDYAKQLVEALAKEAPEHLLLISEQIANEGGQYSYVLKELIQYFHQYALLTVTQATIPYDFKLEDLHLYYQIAVKGLDELHLAPTPQIGFEMTLLRMHAFRPVQRIQSPSLPLTASPSSFKPTKQQSLLPSPSPQEAPPVSTHITPEPTNTVSPHNITPEQWPNFLASLKLEGLALNAAENAVWSHFENKHLALRVSIGHQALFTPAVIQRLKNALELHLGEIKDIKIITDEKSNSSPAMIRKKNQADELQKATHTLEADPFFKKLQTELEGVVVKDSIIAIKNEL